MTETDMLTGRARALEAQLTTLLRARVRQLETEVAALRLTLGAEVPDVEAARLSPRESELVRLLFARDERTSAEDLARGIFGERARIVRIDGEYDDRQTVRTMVDRARRKLRGVGWDITNQPYVGYRLERIA